MCGNAATAQNAPAKDSSIFALGVVDKLQSAELGETRTLNIYLPEGYRDTATYPVIYLLDGSANEDFIHIVGLVQFLTMIEAMPKSIVVGIANVDRRRDFTFPTTITKDKQDYPTTGSSAKFMLFIEKELQPYIEHKYRVNNSKTIIGQSLGGLFAAEVLLKKPTLFNNYIIISPSFWWDNESLLAAASQLLQQHSDNNIQAYVSVGSEGKQMQGDAKKFVSLLKQNGHIQTSFVFMPEENHLTILHNSAYKALEILNKKK
jgi:predicted alpha/beta superfamily hydrolase